MMRDAAFRPLGPNHPSYIILPILIFIVGAVPFMLNLQLLEGMHRLDKRTSSPRQQDQEVAPPNKSEGVKPAPSSTKKSVDNRSGQESDKEDEEDDGIPHYAKEGVHPVYIDLFKEAKIKSESDYEHSHRKGKRGIIIGPTEGDFERYTYKALQNAKRIRRVLAPTSEHGKVKLALMSSPEHINLLNSCGSSQQITRTEKNGEIKGIILKEACLLWANGTIFDDVIPMHETPSLYDDHANLDQGTSGYWLRALNGYRLAPYKHSLFLDSDAYPCPRVEALFHLSSHGLHKYEKYWQLPSTRPADFAIGIEQYPISFASNHWIPGDATVLTDFNTFSERNTGVVLWSFERRVAHAFAHFIPLVSEHIYKNVATKKVKVTNDQIPLRVATYLFRRLEPDFVEHQIPMHASCRTYPGMEYAGTDGFANGMYPLQQDGKHCSECSCTPCLVNHCASTYFVTVKGYKGWELDIPANVSLNKY